jgi:DNA-damage-inducible protein D
MSDQTAGVSPFEAIKHTTQDSGEYWEARELSDVLGYAKWANFVPVIEKAKEACKGSGQAISDHFAKISLPVTIGRGPRET